MCKAAVPHQPACLPSPLPSERLVWLGMGAGSFPSCPHLRLAGENGVGVQAATLISFVLQEGAAGGIGMRLRKKGERVEHVWKGFVGEILESKAGACALS